MCAKPFASQFRLMVLGLSLLVTTSACTLGASPEPEGAPPPPPASQAQLEKLAHDVAELRAYLMAVDTELTLLKPVAPQVAYLDQQVKVLASQRVKPVPKTKRSRPVEELDLLTAARQTARVEITPVNFHGGSAELTYTWQPGQLYPIHLSWNAPTLIVLPPGEQLLVGFSLDEEQYTVKTERAGQEPLTQDVISVKPKFEKGGLDTFLVTNQAHRYLFRFIVGAVGALSVTFETPSVGMVGRREPKLILPNPNP